MIRKNRTAPPPPQTAPADADRSANSGASADSKNILSDNKGKLAIGVAATLGIMIFYNWRQKKLSKEDPEAYARLQKIKNSVKADGAQHAKPQDNEKHRKAATKK
jgi:predicted negative regulator of RcsB-dependent stress response